MYKQYFKFINCHQSVYHFQIKTILKKTWLLDKQNIILYQNVNSADCRLILCLQMLPKKIF